MSVAKQLLLLGNPVNAGDLPAPQQATLLALSLGNPVLLAGVWYPVGMWDTPLPRSSLRALAEHGLITWDSQNRTPPCLTPDGERCVRRLRDNVDDVRRYVRTHLQRTPRRRRRALRAQRAP